MRPNTIVIVVGLGFPDDPTEVGPEPIACQTLPPLSTRQPHPSGRVWWPTAEDRRILSHARRAQRHVVE